MAHAPAHYVGLRVDGVQLRVPKGAHADVKRLIKPYETEFGEPVGGDEAFEKTKEALKKANQKVTAKNKNISDMQKEIKTLKQARSGGGE